MKNRKAIAIYENAHKFIKNEYLARKENGVLCSMGSIASEYIINWINHINNKYK